MDKELVGKISSVVLFVLAIAIIFTIFFKSDNANLVGKWELSLVEKNAVDCLEFYSGNTGLQYNCLSDGDTYDEETFNYRLDGTKLTIDLGWETRVYPYEISGQNLLLDGKLYCKTGGSNPPWVRWVLAVACLIASIVIYRPKNNLPKKKDSNVASISKAVSAPENRFVSEPKHAEELKLYEKQENPTNDWFKSAGDL